MDNKKRMAIQGIATLIQNANIKGFFTGKIYEGITKKVCVPGLNCYSCPGATYACPIGSLQNTISGYKFKFPYYVLGFLSYHIFDRKDSSNYNKLLDKIFASKEQVLKIYKYLVALNTFYRNRMEKDYNVLIKTKINEEILQKELQNLKVCMEEEYQLLTKSL